jgi:transcriptional regulator with XRE-family HTH domain
MPRPAFLDQALGDVLREIRLHKGLSQEELALACDRHRTYVSLLERGRNSPSVRPLFVIAQALEVSPSSVLKR